MQTSVDCKDAMEDNNKRVETVAAVLLLSLTGRRWRSLSASGGIFFLG
jgi:hypothetical protein